MDLYLFNPETDLALATHGANYTASEKIRQMAHDLAVLPLWYAPEESAILVPDEESADFITKTTTQLGKTFFPVRKKNLPNWEIKKVQQSRQKSAPPHGYLLRRSTIRCSTG